MALRIVHSLEAVISVIDSYTKLPVDNAAVYSKGLYNKAVVSKGKGQYLLPSLSCGEVHVSASGYAPAVVKTSGIIGEEITVSLNYSADSPKLKSISFVCFDIIDEKSGSPLIDMSLTVVLTKKTPPLRIIEDYEPKSGFIKLNSGFSKALIFSEYITNAGERVFIKGYDYENASFILEAPLEKGIKSGECLSPVYKLVTDSKGRAILPLEPLFVTDGEVEFKLFGEAFPREIKLETTLNGREMHQKVVVKPKE